MSSEDDGYVHRPGAAREDDSAETSEDAASGRAGQSPADADTGSPAAQGQNPAATDRDMGNRGWVILAVLVFSLLVVPGLVLWNPPALPYWVALLALPMLPAIVLGIVAVWATTRP